MKSLFTAEHIEDLKKEFVEVYINDMNIEQLKDWIRVVYLGELNKCTEDEIYEGVASLTKKVPTRIQIYYEEGKVHIAAE